MLNRDTGEFVDVTEWITQHLYSVLIDTRVTIAERIQAGNPQFLCADCFVPIYIVSRSEERIFFFRHIHEDGSCPAQTRSLLTADDITARKYHGLRESRPHKDIKALIKRSLRADPRFEDMLTERRWRSASNPDRYRQPDVQARAESQRFAFEVQLSTTFLSVVAGRRAFYRSEGALLIWIFGSFDPAYRRLTTDDLLFSNNSNIFIIDEETALRSEETGRFHLRCFHREPSHEAWRMVDTWHEAIVPFDTLTIDLEAQRLFAFDYEAAAETLRAKIISEEQQRRAHQIWIEQQDFYEFWLIHGAGFRHTKDNRATWQALRQRFRDFHQVVLPEWPDSDGEIRAMLNAFYSLKKGEPVGWKFRQLVEVAHCLAENHPALLSGFGFAVKVFERGDTLRKEDVSRRWQGRLNEFGPALNRRNPHYLPDMHVLPLMRFLFPEIAARVDSFWKPITTALAEADCNPVYRDIG